MASTWIILAKTGLSITIDIFKFIENEDNEYTLLTMLTQKVLEGYLP